MEADRSPRMLSRLTTLADHLRIAVIYGGDKRREGAVLHPTHNFRPWKSYEAVARDIRSALLRLGFRNVVLLAEGMALPAQLAYHDIHLAWLNTGGVQGASAAGHAAALLEMLGVPYVGHGPVQTMLLDTKDVFKRQLQSLGIPTSPFVVWHPDGGLPDVRDSAAFAGSFRGFAGPFVVKPVSGRASLNVHVVETAGELPAVTLAVYEATRGPVLVEQYLPGREFTVSVAGCVTHRDGVFYRRSEPFAFSLLERVLDAGEQIFTSMDSRPITPQRVRPLPPEEAELGDGVHRLARRLYRELNLHTLVRADIRADTGGALQVLEVNPKPDLKHPDGEVTSLVAAGLAREGMSYDDLILSLLADRLDYLLAYQPGAFPHFEDFILRHLDGSAEPLLSTA